MLISNRLKSVCRLLICRPYKITPATICTGFPAVKFSYRCCLHTSTRRLSSRQLRPPFESLHLNPKPADQQRKRWNNTDEPEYTLSEEQLEALSLVQEGKNVFITGRAGTGKSVLIREIIRQAREIGEKIAVTAPTGSAALLIDGMTIHSWAGIGAGDKCMNYYKLSGFSVREWNTTNLLIIDEISMVQPRLFDLLDMLAKRARKSIAPFGGLQVVVCGDFLQLPPVHRLLGPSRQDECDKCGNELLGPHLAPTDALLDVLPEDIHDYSVDPERWKFCKHWSIKKESVCGHLQNETITYAFQSRSWLEAEFEHIFLKTVHRQTNLEWISHLNRIARGEVNEDTLDYLMDLTRPLAELPSGVKPTKLHATRDKVNAENAAELARLPGPKHIYRALDSASLFEDIGDGYLGDRLMGPVDVKSSELERTDYKKYLDYYKHLQCSAELTLKVGAQVMLLVNIKNLGLVNGSRGVVVRFESYPSLDSEMIPPKAIHGRVSSDKQESSRYFSKNASTITDRIAIPIVHFADPDIELPIVPCEWHRHVTSFSGGEPDKPNYESGWREQITSNSQIMALKRVQIPLSLAWAATIHKTQGQTLELVIIDTIWCFAPGQAYVGLSRCKSPENMQVLVGPEGRETLREAFKAAPQVLRFYAMLEGKVPITRFSYYDRALKPATSL